MQWKETVIDPFINEAENRTVNKLAILLNLLHLLTSILTRGNEKESALIIVLMNRI